MRSATRGRPETPPPGGELDDLPYEVEFASFASGPLVNEAFAAGAIDIGIMGDTPALLSYASGLDTVVVGIRRATASPRRSSPARHGIESLDDFEGKQVAWTTGTNQHGFVLRALDSVGLTQDDVEQVDVPLTDVANVLASDQADAAVLYEVFRPPYIDEHPDAVELVKLQDFIPSYIYLLATRDVVEDPARPRQSTTSWHASPARACGSTSTPTSSSRRTTSTVRSRRPSTGSSPTTPRASRNGSRSAARPRRQQEQADLFHEAGFLPEPVDLGPQFDPEITEQFTNAIQEARNDPARRSSTPAPIRRRRTPLAAAAG